MSARRKPVAVVGQVHVLAPTTTGSYYRLTWINPDGRPGRTTAGRTLDGAQRKAADIDADLQRAQGPKALTTLGQIAKWYYSSPEGRNQKNHEDWTGSQRLSVEHALIRSLRGFENRTAMELDRGMADRIRAQAGTRNTVRQNTSALKGLLGWGHAQGYFSTEQAEMLPDGAVEVAPAIKGTAAPNRRGRGRSVTQSSKFVRSEDAPSKEAVARLGDEFLRRVPWGKLAVELAASSGPRWGEQMQLTAHDVLLDEGAAPLVQIRWQIDPAARVSRGDDRRKLPKGEKWRDTGVPLESFTGFPQLAELRMRCAAALEEQEAGINPEALLFPAVRGGMCHHSAFMSDLFTPAAVAADWPRVEWTEHRDRWDGKGYRREMRIRHQFPLTWHSLRHRFAREAIDRMNLSPGQLKAVGGWESEMVVRDRYYNSGEEHTISALAKF